MKRALIVADIDVPALSPPPASWAGHNVTLDGKSIFVRDMPATSPDAEPALYIHGLGGSGQNWTDLATLLSGRLDGQAIDLPGFGQSEPTSQYGVAAFAHRVIRWIEYSDRGPVHLFGNSLGGAVTVRVAAQRPDLVRSLTLISAAMPFLDPRWSVQSRFLPLLMLPGAGKVAHRRMAREDPAVMSKAILEMCFSDPSRITDTLLTEATEAARRQMNSPGYGEVYVKTFRNLIFSFMRAYLPGSGSLWKLAAKIEAPTLVIAGRQDRLVDVRVAPRVAKSIPDSRLLILNHVGHVAQMEVPRVVAGAALGLLEELAETANVD